MTRSTSRWRSVLQRLPQFIKQPRVLDGDNGLSRKVCDKSNLFVGKGTNFVTGKWKVPISSLSFSIGTTKRANPAKFNGSNHASIVSFNVDPFVCKIGDVDCP